MKREQSEMLHNDNKIGSQQLILLKQKEALNNIDDDLLEHPKDELIRLFEKDMMSPEIMDDENDGTTGVKLFSS